MQTWANPALTPTEDGEPTASLGSGTVPDHPLTNSILLRAQNVPHFSCAHCLFFVLPCPSAKGLASQRAAGGRTKMPILLLSPSCQHSFTQPCFSPPSAHHALVSKCFKLGAFGKYTRVYMLKICNDTWYLASRAPAKPFVSFLIPRFCKVKDDLLFP